MSETKHTPGPWTCGGGRYLPIVAKRNGERCQIGRAESCGSHNLPSEEVEANGVLMAAAPDLLEACRFVKAHLDSLESALPENDPLRVARRYYHAPLHAKLDAAIAKAEAKS